MKHMKIEKHTENAERHWGVDHSLAPSVVNVCELLIICSCLYHGLMSKEWPLCHSLVYSAMMWNLTSHHSSISQSEAEQSRSFFHHLQKGKLASVVQEPQTVPATRSSNCVVLFTVLWKHYLHGFSVFVRVSWRCSEVTLVLLVQVLSLFTSSKEVTFYPAFITCWNDSVMYVDW